MIDLLAFMCHAMFTSVFIAFLNIFIQFPYILHNRRFHSSVNCYQPTIADVRRKMPSVKIEGHVEYLL